MNDEVSIAEWYWHLLFEMFTDLTHIVPASGFRGDNPVGFSESMVSQV